MTALKASQSTPSGRSASVSGTENSQPYSFRMDGDLAKSPFSMAWTVCSGRCAVLQS
jgi:hypothetical protein